MKKGSFIKICAFIHSKTKKFPSGTANPPKIIMPLCKNEKLMINKKINKIINKFIHVNSELVMGGKENRTRIFNINTKSVMRL